MKKLILAVLTFSLFFSTSSFAGKKMSFSVPPGAQARHFPFFNQNRITFTTNDAGADFYLHVEDTTASRNRIYQGQAQVLKDGKSGLGPYILESGSLRKIFTQNGTNGTVIVKIEEI